MAKLAPDVSMFSRESLFSEFRSRLRYGFLEGICLFSTVYESQLKRASEEGQDPEEDPRPRYSDYKDAVLAMVGDVIRLQFQGEPPPPLPPPPPSKQEDQQQASKK